MTLHRLVPICFFLAVTGPLSLLSQTPMVPEFEPQPPKAVSNRDSEPDIGDFVSVEKEPSFEYEELAGNVVYPDIARRDSIEGQVLVGALIGTDGKVEKTQILSSDHNYLNISAATAVKATRFTPAIKDGKPLRMWVRIPIVYRLR